VPRALRLAASPPAEWGTEPKCFFAETHVWKELKGTGTTPSGRHFPNIAVVRNQLVLFGGFDGDKWCSDVHLLNLGEALGG
jgi:hypothetical protein